MFSVSACNAHGCGTNGPSLGLQAVGPPDKPTISKSYSGSGVKIDWLVGSDNGSPVSSFTISIRNKAKDYFYEDPNCDGSSM